MLLDMISHPRSVHLVFCSNNAVFVFEFTVNFHSICYLLFMSV